MSLKDVRDSQNCAKMCLLCVAHKRAKRWTCQKVRCSPQRGEQTRLKPPILEYSLEPPTSLTALFLYWSCPGTRKPTESNIMFIICSKSCQVNRYGWIFFAIYLCTCFTNPSKIPVEKRGLPVYISDAAGLSQSVIYNSTKYVNPFLAQTNKSCFYLPLTFLLEQSQEQIWANPGG